MYEDFCSSCGAFIYAGMCDCFNCLRCKKTTKNEDKANYLDWVCLNCEKTTCEETNDG